MLKSTLRNYWLSSLAILLVLPAVYFILISIMKYGLSIDGPFDSSESLWTGMGIRELLIVGGPIIALMITIFQVLGVEWQFNREQFQFRFTVQKKWFPLCIAFISGLVLASIVIYLIGENFSLAELNSAYYAK